MSEICNTIIKKWGNESKDPKEYIFPILKKGLSHVDIASKVDTFVRNANKALAKIGAELELSLRLTTYVARHSFATIQKNNNVPMIYLKESMGHADIKTTQDYFSSFEDDSLKEIHGGLLSGLID